MSKRNDGGRSAKVGPGSPPEKHRFKPGQSGNPKGRPRKESRSAAKLNPLEQAFRDAFLEEANREITINEGGKQRTMTAHQGVVRSTVVSALKGSAHAQRTILQMGLEIERREQKAHSDLLGQALDLKQRLEVRRQLWIASGRREEDIPLHPDDIEIDPQTLEVRIHHAFTSEQLSARAELISARDEVLEWIARAESTLAEKEAGEELVQWGLEFAQKQLPVLNAALPPRLRRDCLISATETGGKAAEELPGRPDQSEPPCLNGLEPPQTAPPEDSDCLS